MQFAAFDPAYLERLNAGDARTEQHFVAYFSELILLKLRTRLSSREAIEDVRQETFARVLTLLRAKGGIRQPERLGVLVNSVCNLVLLEHYRSKNKNRNESNIDEEMENVLVDEGPTISGIVQVDESQQVVHRILAELPERDRRLLQGVLIDERDKDELCKELGLSRDYLRVLVHRAKQTFKAYYLKRSREGGSWS